MAKIPDGAYSTSQYARNLSEYKAKEDALTYWENLLQPATIQYQSELQGANVKKGYDITNAYQNYLNYETQLRNSALLGTSKNQLSSQAKSTYDTSYSKALSNYYNTVGKSTETYNKAISAAEENIYKEAETVKAIDESLKSYIADNYKSWGYTDEDYGNMFTRLNTGESELSDIGKQLYAQAMDSVYTQDKNSEYFGKNVWLSDLSRTNPKLYDYVVDNQEKIRKVLADYTEKDYNYAEYTKDKFDYDTKTKIGTEEFYNKKYNIKDYVDLSKVNMNKGFSSTKDVGTYEFKYNGIPYEAVRVSGVLPDLKENIYKYKASEIPKKIPDDVYKKFKNAGINFEKITDLPEGIMFKVDGNYYMRKDDSLYRVDSKILY